MSPPGRSAEALGAAHRELIVPRFHPTTGRGRERSRWGAVISLGLVAVLAVTSSNKLPVAGAKAPLDPWGQVQHVIIVLMENHAYDNYFGTYCPAVSKVCTTATLGIPPGTCVPYNASDPALGCIKPYNLTAKALSEPDMPHYAGASLIAWDHGRMDGFYQAEGDSTEPFGTYNGTLIPTYWDIAEEFGLADNAFSSTLSYSLPNHWYMIAASEPAILRTLMGDLGGTSIKAHHTYLNEANNTTTVEQELDAKKSVSWTYYDYNLQTYQAAINDFNDTVGVAGAYNNWNPLAAKAQSYSQTQHFAPTAQFFTDLSAGHLANISWVIPGSNDSDHPPSNVTRGQDFIASILNAVGRSPYWNSTATFITWDDYGGFYDHVTPPVIDSLGYSFRVPLLVVSPWTPKGKVSETMYSFESLLRFVEWRWGLGCLQTRDCDANLPKAFFNFALHRAPVDFPPWSQAVYPYRAPPPGTPWFVQSLQLSDGWISNESMAD